MGQSGTGKTTILRELTGLDLKVGETMGSGMCTSVSDVLRMFADTVSFSVFDRDSAIPCLPSSN